MGCAPSLKKNLGIGIAPDDADAATCDVEDSACRISGPIAEATPVLGGGSSVEMPSVGTAGEREGEDGEEEGEGDEGDNGDKDVEDEEVNARGDNDSED